MRRPDIKKIIPIIGIIVIIFAIIIGFEVFSNIPVKISQHDNVKIDYTVWVSDEEENYDMLNPILDTVLWVSMIPITENESSGIILGLYNNLLEKTKFYNSGLIWLNRCIDEDRNGIDDNTGKPALTYGNSADIYFDTCLMIQFQVLNIEKPPNSPQFTELEKSILFIIGVIIISIGAGATILIGGYYLNKYRKYRKAKPKTVKERHYTRKEQLKKYGVLGILLGGIVIIILGITHLYFPLQLIVQLYPQMFWLVAILILIIWVLIIPLYLILYRIVRNRKG
jgi:hypothetical protein